MLRDAGLIAGKDLRIEMRSKVGAAQVIPFAVVILLLFAFALEPDRGVLARAAGGLFWVAVLLATVLGVQRSFSIESNGAGRDGLRLSGLDPAGIFLGKAAALFAQLLVLEVVLAAIIVFLYDVPARGALLLSTSALLATWGLAAAGTLYGVLAAGVRAKETLLPLLFLPVVAPVLLAAARASDGALLNATADGWVWTRILAVFAVIYTAVGAVAFEPLLEDS